MKTHITDALTAAQSALTALLSSQGTLDAISQAASVCCTALQNGNKIISCGNGGSMSDAMHFAEELTGRFRKSRAPLPAFAISDPGYLSCTANDFGYEQVFARMVQAFGKPGDVLVGISTSGKSPNVIQAARTAKPLGLHVIGLTGAPQSELSQWLDVDICTPGGSSFADRTQELHIKVIHILIELIERELFPENYRP